jgi:hypothetical protein
MEPITLEQLPVLKARFGNFHDAVIHGVTLGLFSDQGKSAQTLRLLIGAPDHHAVPPTNYYEFVNIEFQLVGVESFVLIKPWNYNLSVIFEMGIFLQNGKIYFIEGISERTSEDDLSLENFVSARSPSLFLVAQEAYYRILPYAVRDF